MNELPNFDVTTKEGQDAFIEHLREVAKDPDMKDIFLRMM